MTRKKVKKSSAAKSLRKWEGEYPDHPDLTCENVISAMELVFLAVKEGRADYENKELHDAAILHRFCTMTYASKVPDKWICEWMADRVFAVLAGAVWDERFSLPERALPESYGVRHKLDDRDLKLYCAVQNMVNAGVAVTKALSEVAQSEFCSLETVRAAYYDWKNRLADLDSKKSP
ncbi:hypothetical protein [Stenotrophomonas sp.]|uniref:hypothetical protein n=1 Tax=Stenotrophomonas sp. TaxID=69392 RepID=UPI0025CC212A|nr:hypothetical protein [Stenotrophomonas sp.]MBW8373619.1 hypothetical protein [Stenotrophomonas sp.]